MSSCGNPNHLIGECPKPPKDKNQRAFVRGSWSDSDDEDDEKVKDETCLVALASSEEYLSYISSLDVPRETIPHHLLISKIKQWNSVTKTSDRVTKHDNLQLIKSIEKKIRAGFENDDECDSRVKLLQEVDRLDTFELFDLFQKARVKWDIEEKFKDHDLNVDFPLFANTSGLRALDRHSLETPVSLDEVKNTVWDCGSSKALGPDGYVVPAGKVIIIVSPGRLSLVPTGRVLSPGICTMKGDDASVHSEATIAQQQQNIQPQIILLDSNTMQVSLFDKMNTLLFQRESKARTTLLSVYPDVHVANCSIIWMIAKGYMVKMHPKLVLVGNVESKKMRMSMLKSSILRVQKLVKQRGIAQRFLRALPSSCLQLKTLEVDIKGYSTFSSSHSAGSNHSAFVSTTSANKKMSYIDSPSYSSSTYTAPSNSKTGSHRSSNVIEDVLQSFVADTEPEQQLLMKILNK
ncbi:hypothetical protein Tco_0839806 [Tanacetum coccineum]|uniref:Uncharacterized protein n=1 Tax=Tanacetum coccineum TaxID=301880 RepID=A0ABQ5ATK8_9ASTR